MIPRNAPGSFGPRNTRNTRNGVLTVPCGAMNQVPACVAQGWFGRQCSQLVLLFACLACFAGSLPLRAASFRGDFRAGCVAYADGHFERASSIFGNLARSHPTAAVYHNLGNALWHRNQVGEAILAWERAEWLNPFDSASRTNLDVARQATQLDGPDLAWYEICSTWLPADVWPWLAMVSFWVAVALLLLPGILGWRRSDRQQAVAAAGFAVFLLTVPALVGVQTRSQLGIIRQGNTRLRLTPTREAQVLARLQAGDVVRMAGEHGAYVYVRTEDDSAGWVQHAEFARIASR